MSFIKRIFSVTVGLTLLTSAGRLLAQQTCTSDANCPNGFVCKGSTLVTPETEPCPPNTVCPKPQPRETPTVVKTCEPKSCTVDADCGGGMICFEHKSTTCSGASEAVPPCAPDRPCDAGAPVKVEESCTTTTVKACAFKWQLPCNADLDCGSGFTCKPTVTGACSGSGGTASGGTDETTGGSGRGGGGATKAAPPRDSVGSAPTLDGGAAPPPSMCTTTTSYPGWCQPTATTCNVDSDCPANWKCIDATDEAGSDSSVTSPAPAPTGGSSGGGGKRTAADQLAAAPVKMCWSTLVPPVRGYDAKSASTDGPNLPGGGTTQGEAAGSAGPKPTTPTSTDDGKTKGVVPSSTSGGCAVGGAGGAGGAGLALVALVGLLISRRRRS